MMAGGHSLRTAAVSKPATFASAPTMVRRSGYAKQPAVLNPRFSVLPANEAKLLQLLEHGITSWEFDALQLDTLSGGHALSTLGRVYSWGDGDYGVLGHGDRESVPHPKLIRSLRNVTAVVSAFFHALAITSDGALWSWGDDQDKFSLGHGDNHVSEGVELLPRRIGALSGKPILSVAAGLWHSLAVGVDGGCYSWGTNSYGQLGQEGPERETPTRIDALRGICVSSVAAFEMLSCAVSPSFSALNRSTCPSSRPISRMFGANSSAPNDLNSATSNTSSSSKRSAN